MTGCSLEYSNYNALAANILVQRAVYLSVHFDEYVQQHSACERRGYSNIMVCFVLVPSRHVVFRFVVFVLCYCCCGGGVGCCCVVDLVIKLHLEDRSHSKQR